MRLPRWLAREYLFAAERVYAKEKAREAGLYFGLWRDVCGKLDVARAERAQALDEVKALERRLDAARQAHQIARTEHFDEVKRIQDERARWERLAEQALVPPPSVLAGPDDRAGLYRLTDENARLRDRVAELEAKYEGNPSQ